MPFLKKNRAGMCSWFLDASSAKFGKRHTRPNSQFLRELLFDLFAGKRFKAMQQAHAKSVVSTVEREAWPTLNTQSLETPEADMFADTNGISPTIQ